MCLMFVLCKGWVKCLSCELLVVSIRLFRLGRVFSCLISYIVFLCINGLLLVICSLLILRLIKIEVMCKYFFRFIILWCGRKVIFLVM